MAPQIKVVWTLGAAVAFIAVWFLWSLISWLIRLENPQVLEVIDFADDIKLELIVEADVDVENTLSYRILDGEIEIVPRTSLGIYKRKDEYQLIKFQDSSGSLVGVHSVDPLGRDEPLLVIFDKENEESWPRLQKDEEGRAPNVKMRWLLRFSQIQSNHPELPRTRYFQD